MTGSDCSGLVSGPARQETNQDRTEDRAPHYLSIIRRGLFLPRSVSDLIERESGYFGQTDATVHFLTAVTDWMRHILGEAGVLDHYRGQEGGEGGITQLIYYQQIKNISTFLLQRALMFPTGEDVVGLRD